MDGTEAVILEMGTPLRHGKENPKTEIENQWKELFLKRGGQCQFCEMRSHCYKQLRSHEIDKHPDKLVHVCAFSGCGQKYSSAPILQLHCRIHYSTAPYKCTMCEHICMHSFQVEDHIMLCHIPQKPVSNNPLLGTHSCPYCNEIFKLKLQLQQHCLIGHNSKPYPCKICPNKAYGQSKDLKDHLLKYHHVREHGEKTLSCEECPQQFATKFMLDTHMSSHNSIERPPTKIKKHSKGTTVSNVSRCTFCMKPVGNSCRIIDDPTVTRFLCEEYKINFEQAFTTDVQAPNSLGLNPSHDKSLIFAFCDDCSQLFAEMGQLKVQFDAVRAGIDDVLSKIKLKVLETNDDETVNSNWRILRKEIIRSTLVCTVKNSDVVEEGNEKSGNSKDATTTGIQNSDAKFHEVQPAKSRSRKQNFQTLEVEMAAEYETGVSLTNFVSPVAVLQTSVNLEEIKVKMEQDCPFEPEDTEAINFNDVAMSSIIESDSCADSEITIKDVRTRSLEEMQNQWKLKYINVNTCRAKCRFCAVGCLTAIQLRKHEVNSHGKRLVHRCTSCKQKYSSTSILETHKQIHLINGPYECKICNIHFTHPDNMEDHLLQNHIPLEPIQFNESDTETSCLICSRVFESNKILASHVRSSHNKKKHKCDICPKICATQAGLTNHYVISHETGKKELTCEKCPKKFVTKYMQQKHIDNHSLDSTKPLNCEKCDLRTDDPIVLENHIKSSHGAKTKPHKCPGMDCDKTFQSLSQLRYHEIKRHPELFIYSCNLCDKSYTLKTFLETHLRTHSDIDLLGGSYKCSICTASIVFSTSNDLAHHLSKHTGEDKIQCTKCSKKFKHHEELARHLVRFHKAEKPFKCEDCFRSFITSSSLRAHKELHEDPAELLKRKPNKTCNHCGLQFITRLALLNHKREHRKPKEYKICYICAKSVKNMTSHLKLHKGEKNYVCYFCNKRSLQATTHTYHLYTHTKEKPYICPKCGKDYNQPPCLTKHMAKCRVSDSNSNANSHQSIGSETDGGQP